MSERWQLGDKFNQIKKKNAKLTRLPQLLVLNMCSMQWHKYLMMHLNTHWAYTDLICKLAELRHLKCNTTEGTVTCQGNDTKTCFHSGGIQKPNKLNEWMPALWLEKIYVAGSVSSSSNTLFPASIKMQSVLEYSLRFSCRVVNLPGRMWR